MNPKTNLAKAFLATILTCLPFAAHAGPVIQGGADGGGGYQYPNAKALLKAVAVPLAKDIERMHDGAFANFPGGIGREQFAAIIRGVVSTPNEPRERVNAAGEMEGLMFDYDPNFCDSKGCGPRIIARQAFFDAYKGFPVQQLEKRRAQGALKSDDMYLMVLADVRQRLVHEAAHLLGIGATAATDWQGDAFYERFEQARRSQMVYCVMPKEKIEGGKVRFGGFVLDLTTGRRADMGFDVHVQNFNSTLQASGKAETVKRLKNAFSRGVDENGALAVQSDTGTEVVTSYMPTAYKMTKTGAIWDSRAREALSGIPAGSLLSSLYIDFAAQTAREVTISYSRAFSPYARFKSFAPHEPSVTDYQCEIKAPAISLKF